MQHINTTLNLEKPEHEIKQDIKELLVKVFDAEDTSSIMAKPLTGGITNKLYKITLPNRSVLCRINGMGTEFLLDREKEASHMKLLSKHNQGPVVHFTFDNGFVYEFKHGRSLTANELKEHMVPIAQKMADFHKIESDTFPRESNILAMLGNWFTEIKTYAFDDQIIQQKVDRMNIPQLEREMKFFQEISIKYQFDIVFCHNDLLPGNIIYNEKTDEIHFIDYEYCGYNFRGFDIGNHFCEYSGFSINSDKYPSIDTQREFLKIYAERAKLNHLDDDVIEKLRVEANFCSLLANLAWGTWAIFQLKNSNIDFNYLSYGRKKIEWYWKTKDTYLQELELFHAKN